MAYTQNEIDTLINAIKQAEAPSSVTNKMVAAALDFLNSEKKDLTTRLNAIRRITEARRGLSFFAGTLVYNRPVGGLSRASIGGEEVGGDLPAILDRPGGTLATAFIDDFPVDGIAYRVVFSEKLGAFIAYQPIFGEDGNGNSILVSANLYRRFEREAEYNLRGETILARTDRLFVCPNSADAPSGADWDTTPGIYIFKGRGDGLHIAGNPLTLLADHSVDTFTDQIAALQSAIATIDSQIAELDENVVVVAEELSVQNEQYFSTVQALLIAANKAYGVTYLQEAGTEVVWGDGEKTVTPVGVRKWFTKLTGNLWPSGGSANIVEIANLATKGTSFGNRAMYYYTGLQKFVTISNPLPFTSLENLFQNCPAEYVDISRLDLTPVTVLKAAFPNQKTIVGIEDFYMPNLQDVAQTFSGNQKIDGRDGELNLSKWGCRDLLYAKSMLDSTRLLRRIILSGWGTRKVTDFNLGRRWGAWEYLDLTGWDTRSATTMDNWLFSATWNDDRLAFVRLSADFFTTRCTLDFANITYGHKHHLGFTDMARSESSGWLEHIAQVAPTIRLAADWDEEAWQADILEENEETPRLLTEEDGNWYLNDGVARTIMLHDYIKSADFALPWLAMFVSKGYTIA